MIMSPLFDRNGNPLFYFVLPGTNFIAQMLPLLNIMFGSNGHSLSTVNCAPHLSLLLLCSVFSACFLRSFIWLGAFPLSSRIHRSLRSWERYIHTCIHTCMYLYIYIHKYIPFFLIPSFFFTYHLSHIFRSFTTSFIFPSFPVGTITSHKAYRKNLQNLRFHNTKHYIQAYIYTIFSYTIILYHTRSPTQLI